jgi:hypothetical protein
VLLWLVEGTWEGCVAAAEPLLPADAEVALLHVAPGEVEEAAGGALAGLLGRGRRGPGHDPAGRISASLGPVTRFVVDHAPCAVLLVWPDGTPAVESIPPPPPGPPHPPGPP